MSYADECGRAATLVEIQEAYEFTKKLLQQPDNYSIDSYLYRQALDAIMFRNDEASPPSNVKKRKKVSTGNSAYNTNCVREAPVQGY